MVGLHRFSLLRKVSVNLAPPSNNYKHNFSPLPFPLPPPPPPPPPPPLPEKSVIRGIAAAAGGMVILLVLFIIILVLSLTRKRMKVYRGEQVQFFSSIVYVVVS